MVLLYLPCLLLVILRPSKATGSVNTSYCESACEDIYKRMIEHNGNKTCHHKLNLQLCYRNCRNRFMEVEMDEDCVNEMNGYSFTDLEDGVLLDEITSMARFCSILKDQTVPCGKHRLYIQCIATQFRKNCGASVAPLIPDAVVREYYSSLWINLKNADPSLAEANYLPDIECAFGSRITNKQTGTTVQWHVAPPVVVIEFAQTESKKNPDLEKTGDSFSGDQVELDTTPAHSEVVVDDSRENTDTEQQMLQVSDASSIANDLHVSRILLEMLSFLLFLVIFT